MPTCRIVSLGCARNLVDSEVIAGSLKKEGFSLTDKLSCDLCVINTCGFIRKAREESVDAILQAGDLRKKGAIGCLAVCGCLSQLYRGALKPELPEADIIVGTSDVPRLSGLAKKFLRTGAASVTASSRLTYLYDDRSPRQLLTPRHYAYIKIAEGCSNDCSYCIISRLRGRFRSRSIESVEREVRSLGRGGALKEINIIAQDVAQFGVDRTGRRELPRLLRRLANRKDGIEWIRLLYAHPAHVTDELIDVMAGEGRICSYLDLPVQHASDRILRLMNRRVSRAALVETIEKLRRRIPGLVLRTSIIVGFPGETDRDFADLLAFVKDMRFERLGAFMYSREDGTAASRMRGQVPRATMERRLDRLMTVQQAISREWHARRIGSTVRVLVDERCKGAEGESVGRTAGDAPEVDGSVYVRGRAVKVGEFCNVRITGAMEYDLTGEIETAAGKAMVHRS